MKWPRVISSGCAAAWSAAEVLDGNERTARNMEILMGRWRALHEKEIRAFDARNDLGAVRDVATHEWILPDDAPADQSALAAPGVA